jgi:hypothetical protein
MAQRGKQCIEFLPHGTEHRGGTDGIRIAINVYGILPLTA